MSSSFPITYILRHRRENLKKCSLRGLEQRPDFRFLTYPIDPIPPLSSYILLALDAAPLESHDSQHGLFLLDATWRYAGKMLKVVEEGSGCMLKRSIPKGFKTAYPRRQEDCPFPEEGLASIEALYIAYVILKRNPTGLLDGYHWKDQFLEINRDCFGI